MSRMISRNESEKTFKELEKIIPNEYQRYMIIMDDL
jgi:hypothetical protein